MRMFILFICCLFSFAQASADKQIALTFERLPAMGPLQYWMPREISNILLRTLKSHAIPAAGFVVEEKIDDDPASYIVLQDWVEQGHLLGSNTYSYVDLHQLTAEDFLAHVADGHKYLRRASRPGRHNYRFLRFPLLHEGDTESKKRKVAKILYGAGYRIVPVTVKTSDHVFNRLYLERQTDQEKVEEIKQLFLRHLSQSLDYAEKQSKAVFGRQIPQILQLHAGIATAIFLDDLIQMLQERDYKFVPVTEALEDPAFSTDETYAGPLGLTFTDRVALTKGQPVDETHGELSEDQVLGWLKDLKQDQTR